MQGATKSRELTLEKGAVILKQEDKLQCATDSEIKIKLLALRPHKAWICKDHDLQQHSAWETFKFESFHREVPPGNVKAGLSQVISCDKAWARLASMNVSVREAPDGTFPLGEALLNLRNDPAISLYLAPLAKPAQSSSSHATTTKPAPYQQPEHRPQHGKGKRKGGGKGKAPPMPAELRGKYHKTSSNEPMVCIQYKPWLFAQWHG